MYQKKMATSSIPQNQTLLPKSFYSLPLSQKIYIIKEARKVRFAQSKSYNRLILSRLDNRALIYGGVDIPQTDLKHVSELASRYYESEDEKEKNAILEVIKELVKGEVYDCGMFGVTNFLGFINQGPSVVEELKKYENSMARFGGAASYNYAGTNHISLECTKLLTEMTQQEDALLCVSAFQANEAWVVGLIGKNDYVVYDESMHSSVTSILTRSAKASFKHNDVADLDLKLTKALTELQPGGTIFVIIESVDSTLGDLAPIKEIGETAHKKGALLIVDDAHGFGIIGKNGGGGPVECGAREYVDLQVGSINKPGGARGGFLAGKRDLIGFLSLMSAPYGFTASSADYEKVAILAGLKAVKFSDDRRKRLFDNVAYIHQELNRRNIKFLGSEKSGIVAVNVKNTDEAVAGAMKMGVFLNPSEYPAAPIGVYRLRGFISAVHTLQDLDELVKVFEKYYVGNC